MGPVEYLVVEFSGNKFKGEIVPALRALTDNELSVSLTWFSFARMRMAT